MDYQHIQLPTGDDIILNGLYVPGDKKKSACILIHGFTSDFYSHKFYHSIAKSLKDGSNALILAQTRGTGLNTEFIKTNGDGVYIGSFQEKIKDAHLDISAFVKFLIDEGYTKIVLAGHSLGTIKVVRYLFEGEYGNKITKLALLAPFDKNAFMEIKAPGRLAEFLDVAKDKILNGQGKEVVPVPEYEDFPLTYETFYSWYEQSDLNKIWDFYKEEYMSPILQKINIPTKVILGENDEFVNYPQFKETASGVLRILKKQISQCETFLVENSRHTFVGYEDVVANEVSTFLEK